MSNDMTGPSTGGGVLSSLGDRMMGRASGSHAKVSKKSGPLDGLFLSQLIPALLLVLVGTITIWTASLTIADANFPRHLVGVALGLVVAMLIWRYDYRNLAGMTTVLFVITCFLMVMPKIPGLGVSSHGMTGWVKLPLVPVRFQPVELGKPSSSWPPRRRSTTERSSASRTTVAYAGRCSCPWRSSSSPTWEADSWCSSWVPPSSSAVVRPGTGCSPPSRSSSV